MLSANALAAAKALAAKYPAFKSVLLEEDAPAATDAPEAQPVQLPEMTLEIDTDDLAEKIAAKLSQSADGQPEAVDIAEEQSEVDMAQNEAPTAEPEAAQESEDEQLALALGAFIETVKDRLQEVINNE